MRLFDTLLFTVTLSEINTFILELCRNQWTESWSLTMKSGKLKPHLKIRTQVLVIQWDTESPFTLIKQHKGSANPPLLISDITLLYTYVCNVCKYGVWYENTLTGKGLAWSQLFVFWFHNWCEVILLSGCCVRGSATFFRSESCKCFWNSKRKWKQTDVFFKFLFQVHRGSDMNMIIFSLPFRLL